ncbi:MAG: ParB/RepB/Spo0J family partition protein [Planctomycetota bacterium]
MADTAESSKSGSLAGKKRPSRLGRGLSSLMAAPAAVSVSTEPVSPNGEAADVAAAVERPAVPGSSAAEIPSNGGASGFAHLEVASIHPSSGQPRQRFEEAALKRLAESIRNEGLMQPVIVRPMGKAGYELVAGERRWRAAKIAGLEAVPALVKDLDDRQLAEWALIENLQREDLNPIERAEAFERLGDAFGLSHEEIAERVGLERSTVTNLLRLLRLAPAVREMVACEALSMGQSRALAGIESPTDQVTLAERAVKEGMSVRQVEAAAKGLREGGKPSEPTKKAVRAAYLDDLERQIGEQLSTKVQIKTARKKGAGTLSIDFYSIDQFDGLLAKLGVETQ